MVAGLARRARKSGCIWQQPPYNIRMTRIIERIPRPNRCFDGHEAGYVKPSSMLGVMVQALARKMDTPLPRIAIYISPEVDGGAWLGNLGLSYTALEQPTSHIAFIVAHELAHLKQNHCYLPTWLPEILQTWWNHRVEYEADRIAVQHVPIEWGISHFEHTIKHALENGTYNALDESTIHPSPHSRLTRLKALQAKGQAKTLPPVNNVASR